MAAVPNNQILICVLHVRHDQHTYKEDGFNCLIMVVSVLTPFVDAPVCLLHCVIQFQRVIFLYERAVFFYLIFKMLQNISLLMDLGIDLADKASD